MPGAFATPATASSPSETSTRAPIDGIILAGLEPNFVAPELDPELGIAHCLTPESLADALDGAPEAVAALTVSPTYFGAVADVRGPGPGWRTSEACRCSSTRPGALTCGFSPLLPASALECDADLVLSSIHKLLGSLTQSAILHLGDGGRDRRGRGRPMRDPDRIHQPQRAADRVA